MTLLLVMAFISEAINSRVAATVTLQFWAMPLLIALYTFNSQTSSWVYCAVVSLIAGYPYIHPIQVAWASRNSSSVRTRFVSSRILHGGGLIEGIRTISASVYNMFVQLSAIISVNKLGFSVERNLFSMILGKHIPQ
jgi:hypothetical protein